MLDRIHAFFVTEIPFPVLATFVLILFACLCVLLMFWLAPSVKYFLINKKIRSRVKKLGNKIMSNVKLPDDIDGELHIDHLVLKGGKIIVVDVKRYDGLIYGSEHLDTWTQVVNRKSFQFANPLMQIQHRVLAVQSIAPEADVEGAVLFAGRSSFPKRIPDGVITLEDIPTQSEKSAISPKQIIDSWQQLSAFKQRGC